MSVNETYKILRGAELSVIKEYGPQPHGGRTQENTRETFFTSVLPTLKNSNSSSLNLPFSMLFYFEKLRVKKEEHCVKVKTHIQRSGAGRGGAELLAAVCVFLP
jgi:hypothetical protein